MISREKRESQCRETILRFQTMDIRRPISMTEPAFSLFTYPAKTAAKKSGLAFRAGCLQTKNNRLKCRYLFIPGAGAEFLRNGSKEYLVRFEKIRIFKIDVMQEKPRSYQILPLYEFNEKITYQQLATLFTLIAKDRNCIDDVTIDEKSLMRFFICYTEALIQLGIIEQELLDTLSGWKAMNTGEVSHLNDSLIVQPETISQPLDRLLPHTICPAEGVWFSATVFSLFKPLYQLCKVKCDTSFALQLLLKPSESTESLDPLGLWLLEHQARLWSNYREWPKTARYKEQEYPSKFRKHYHDSSDLGYMWHRGFPIVLFNYKNFDYEAAEIEYYKGVGTQFQKKNLERICSTDALPILLPAAPPQKNYVKERCLTLPLKVDVSKERLAYYAEYDRSLRERHESINGYYVSCIKVLNNCSLSEIAVRLNMNYCKALSLVHVKPEKKEHQKRQLACLLGTLLFLREVLEDKGEEVERLNCLIQAFRKDVGIVTLQDFTAFVSEILERPAMNKAVLFGKDADGIYLHFKEYWSAFERYCKQHGIALNESALSFRRTVLIPKRLIRPQYTPSPGAYARYDYRKKLGDKEATVLNLSLDILKEHH